VRETDELAMIGDWARLGSFEKVRIVVEILEDFLMGWLVALFWLLLLLTPGRRFDRG
jgi:hypothetical protein